MELAELGSAIFPSASEKPVSRPASKTVTRMVGLLDTFMVSKSMLLPIYAVVYSRLVLASLRFQQRMQAK